MRTADAALRNAEAVEAMDLMPGIIRRWEKDQSAMLENQGSVARTGAMLLDTHQVHPPDGPDRNSGAGRMACRQA